MPKLSCQSKPQKSLTHNNFVAILQRMMLARLQAPATIYKRSIRRSKIFNQVLAVAKRYARVAARDFRFRIVRVQIYVGKYAAVCIPPANV